MAKEEKELNFEENIKKLETIVKELETGEIPLDDAINKFTEACKIAEICDKKLKNATNSINKILGTDGELKDFEIEES